MSAHRPPAAPIRLHRSPLSGHCHRVELFLSLLGVSVEFVEVDMRGGAHRRPEFLALNPFGQVPVIEDGECVLFDSNAILVYLAKRYGDPSWLPDDPQGAAAVQRWLALAAGPSAYGAAAARLGTRARSRSYRAAPKTPPQSKSPASMGERGFDTGIGRRDAA